MNITLHDHVTGSLDLFEGSPDELETKLRLAVPVLNKRIPLIGRLGALVSFLESSQRYTVEVEEPLPQEEAFVEQESAPANGDVSLAKNAGVLTFPRLDALGHQGPRTAVADYIFSRLPDRHKATLVKLADSAGLDKTDPRYIEELISHPQQYNMSAGWRELIHRNADFKEHEIEAFQHRVKTAWQNVLDLSRKTGVDEKGAYTTALNHPFVDALGKSEEPFEGPLMDDEGYVYPLTKMALADIAPGKTVENPYTKQTRTLYDHLLAPEHVQAGYGLVVVDSPNNNSLSAEVYLKNQHVGGASGMFLANRPPGEFALAAAKISDGHAGKGLGTAAYEALLAHAKNVRGATHVAGDSHSTSASNTHKALARKHGLGYKSRADIGPDAYPDTATWMARKAGPYDFKYAPYKYELKSETPITKAEARLEKMAIADIPKGKKLQEGAGVEWYDYSHVLPAEKQSEGYSVRVKHNYYKNQVVSELYHNRTSVGDLWGMLRDSRGETVVYPEDVSITDKAHRGKGLGKALYEALFSHSYHVGGATSVKGGRHSTLASRVHQSLANKHGLEYTPSPSYPNATFKDKESWEAKESGAYDGKYSGYAYALKSESGFNLEKKEDLSTIAQEMTGFTHTYHVAFDAARFLSASKKDADLDSMRRALYEHDGDTEAAALVAFGLTVSESNRKALRAIIEMQELGKVEATRLPLSVTVEPLRPESATVSAQVKRAYDSGNVQNVKLTGKHSGGTRIARDPQSNGVFLLKPGVGALVTAGANEEPASQSRREAAFYKVAELFGIESFVPRADVLVVDGSEVAAINMLPFTFRNLETAANKNPAFVSQRLNHYRAEGMLHRWAVLDWVLANADRHGQNMMIGPNGEIRLIDHGSAFAGDSFAPNKDKKSFIPYYLRYSTASKFTTLSDKDKLAYMPTVSRETDSHLQEWVEGLDGHRLEQCLLHHGITPQPVLSRLAKVKAAPFPKAEGINRLWLSS